MIQLIVGKKGSGKTKKLVEMINEASEKSTGSLVCVEKGMKLTYDIKYTVRLIDTDDFHIDGFESLYGFVAGVLAGNYDIRQMYIDGILRIGGDDYEALGGILARFEKLSQEMSIDFILTISADESELPEGVKKYL